MSNMIDLSNFDFESLRSDLMDYFGTATSFIPYATVDLIKVSNASLDELIEIAYQNNFDLSQYINNYHK